MQPSAASRRLLSTLSSKIHPQLPLSPRESQQLLNLLTTSFRAHLDREHPLTSTENAPPKAQKGSLGHAQRGASPNRAISSYASTTRHIDSILMNPLFAVKPRRRGSEPAAVDVLRDPMSWFVDEIATGAATLPKAAMCLEVLEKVTHQNASKLKDGRSPAFVLAEWLQTSELDTSRRFLELCITKTGRATRFLDRLVALLIAEHETTAPWRWFMHSSDQRVKETGLDSAKVAAFRQQLLVKMAAAEATVSLDRGIATFMQAFNMTENLGYESAYSVLRPAGAHLVNRISSTSVQSIDPALYQSFLASTENWLGTWSQAVRAMLWLHHPSNRSALPGFQFIKDAAGAITFVQASRSRRQFLVQLSLGVARQLLEQKNYAQAQAAMQFTKEHFADIVLAEPPIGEKSATTQWRARRERENLELLDSLVPT